MLDELTPRSLTAAAKELGLDPFATVQLMVAADAVPAGTLRLDDELLGRLREVGGIDPTWWDDVELPDDDDPRRARVRAAVQLLRNRGFFGESTTRIDNLWRGLDDADRQLLEQAVTALAEEGLLSLVPSPLGLRLSIDAGQTAAAKALADGSGSSAALDAVLED